MLENGDAIVIFRNYGQVAKIQKPDSGCIVCKSYIFNNSNLLSFENWKQFPTQLSSHIIALSEGTIFTSLLFLPDFLQKNADSSKLTIALVPKSIFSETKYVCTLYQLVLI